MLDLLGIAILILSFLRGWRKGIVVALCALLGVVLGMMASLKLSGVFAAWLMEKGFVTSAWAQIVSSVLLFIGVLWIVRLIAKAIEGALKMAMLSLVNKIAGGLLYAAIGAFIWSCVLWIGNRAHMIPPESLAGSHSYDAFAPVAPWIFAHIGAVLPFAKDVFADLDHFFNGVNQHLPGHVGAH